MTARGTWEEDPADMLREWAAAYRLAMANAEFWTAEVGEPCS